MSRIPSHLNPTVSECAKVLQNQDVDKLKIQTKITSVLSGQAIEHQLNLKMTAECLLQHMCGILLNVSGEQCVHSIYTYQPNINDWAKPFSE